MSGGVERTVDQVRSAARAASVVAILAAVAALVVTGVFAAVAGAAPNAFPEFAAEIWPLPASAKTWAQAREAVAVTVAMALGVGVLAALALVLRRFGATGHLPRRRTVGAVVATPPIAVLALLTIVLALNRGEARLTPDCGTFRFDRVAFRSADPNRWEPQAIGLDECRLFAGRTTHEMRRLLGVPDPREPGQVRTAWSYHGGFFVVHFNRGRALELDV